MALIQKRENLTVYFFMLVIMTILALWLKSIEIESSWHRAGLINVSLGFVLLAAYISSKILKIVRLPLISACIFMGIIVGPYVCSFLTSNMVEQLKLVDDLALSFIALTAGGELSLQSFTKRRKAIALNIILLTLFVFTLVFIFIVSSSDFFEFTRNLSSIKIIVLAILLGIVAIARSPSSAIAIISECRAAGTFTDTVLGVTVVMDLLIIIFFTFALGISKIIIVGSSAVDIQVFLALSLEMITSLFIGVVIGKGIAFYIKRVGHDLPLFLLFMAFAVTKTSLWLTHFMEDHFHIFLHLEPLLICMSAGFFVRNFSAFGSHFMENLDRLSLPIYVLFFSMTGAALNLESLRLCWPLALCIVLVRMIGIFCATWVSGKISHDPPNYSRYAWMAYLTQAGVAIGLAQLAQRQFPEIGVYLITIVLAVISVNQIIGPITFKIALNIVKETGKR